MLRDQQAIDEHRNHVRALAKPGNALSPDSPNATINNPGWFRTAGGVLKPRAARVELHQLLKAAELAKYPLVKQEKRAFILAGPPGAGKSTQRRELLGDSEDGYLRIDADDFKEALLLHALEDGSYESYIVPKAIQTAESAGERFFPMELASLVHEESSLLAKQLRDEAIARNDNVVIDAVLSSVDNALALGSQLEAAGYDVEVVNVEVSFEISEERIAQRWQESYELALTNANSADPHERLGGRWVPSEYARDVFNGPFDRSRSEVAAEALAKNCMAVKRYRRFRTVRDADGRDHGPTLEVDQSRHPGSARLVPE